MPGQVMRRYLIPVLATAAASVGIVAAPPAVADCIIDAGGITLCGQGDVRDGNRADPPSDIVSGPVYPYTCYDDDWYCNDAGVALAD